MVAPWVVAATGSNARTARVTVAAAWRKQDRLGRACVSCHSPDGLEIAAYAFSDEDIMRRARSHVSEDDARQIVEMIHGVRKRYNITSLLNPMTDRPMQPGGSLLGGATPVDRDASFAASLQSVVPLFFAGRIDSLAAAKAARDQLLAVDLRQLRIGIPINRLSEDEFHGKDHATIADWLPDVPLARELPVDIQDAYLEDPSAQNYRALDHALADMFAQQSSLAQSYSLDKRRSLFYFQHQLRMRLLGITDDSKPQEPNPLWGLGEFARQAEYVRLTAMGFPKDIIAKKFAGPSSADQLRDLRLSWYWLAWCMDPGMQKTSPYIEETARGDYFTRFLWSDGPYAVHHAFMITRKIATESSVPSAWNSRAPQHLDLNYSGFTNDEGIAGPLPTDPRHKRLFDAFVDNSFRMNLFLQMDELSRTHIVYLRQALNQQIRRMKAVFTDRRDKALADRALSLITQCRDARR